MEKGIVLLDTLCLNVRYPYSDMFNRWYRFAKDADRHVLKRGIVAGDFVVRSGGAGYKFSLWQHDARFYLTDETDEKRGEGNGMGIRIQLGPKFLLQHITELVPIILDLLSDIGIKKQWPIHITRLDLAVDMFNTAMVDQSLKDWQENWVGRSKVSGVYFNSRTGDLETINIGSRTSAIYLRIYDKIAQAIKEGDAIYWLDVWEKSSLGEVTRVEWEIKPKKGNFSSDLVDFYKFNGFSRRELMNYLLEWGRLGIPENDVNRSRWKSAPFWKVIEEIKDEWALGVYWPTSRLGKEFKGISEAYIKQLSGSISGGMARLGGEEQGLIEMIDKMAEYGENLKRIKEKAKIKADIYQKL